MSSTEAISITTPKLPPNKNIQTKPTENKQEYTDPLMNWPVRGLAYSNELGVAIAEIAPKTGTALWIPALMYFGADIYDKYKNDKTDYDPNAKRGLAQAVFQALASVLLPTGAILAGQKIIAMPNLGGLSLQSKEEAFRGFMHFVEHKSLRSYSENIPKFKDDFRADFAHHINEKVSEYKSMPLYKRAWTKLFGAKHQHILENANKELLNKYTDKLIDELFDIRSTLADNEVPEKLSKSLFIKFHKILPEYKKDFMEKHPGLDISTDNTYMKRAAKVICVEHMKKHLFALKLWKTLGGFVSLALLIKPIDVFVEHAIINKYLMPSDKPDKNIDKTV